MNTKTRFSNIILVLLLFLSAILRLYKLGEYPIHLTNDEAALGYNAYSIAKTARDEHGEFLPVVFKSFGDWKPGLYVYLTVPSVALFGVNEFAVRLPSALSGVLTVWFVYLIGRKLFDRGMALFAALSLAIFPWHIHFSRGAWEANIALTLLVVAIWFLLKSIEKNKYLVVSAVFFGLTLWAYQSAKLASVLALFALLFVYKEKFLKFRKRAVLVAVCSGVLISIPIILSLFSGKGGRLEVMSVFSYTRPEAYTKETVLDQEPISKDDFMFTFFHSEAYNLFRGVLGRYFNYFSGRFLFFEGDWANPKHTSVDAGYLLLAEIPVLLVGVWSLLKKSDKPGKFILFWLLLAPIPAALTRDSAHGVRSLNMIIPLSFILGFGLKAIYFYLKSQKAWVRAIGLLAILFAYLYSLFIYLDAYYVQNPRQFASDYLYGYKQTVKRINELKGNYKHIVFDQSFDQPYIFFLFWNVYDPGTFQHSSSYIEGVNGDVGLVRALDDVEFRPINWSGDKSREDTLLVGKVTAFPPEEVTKPDDYKVETIYYPDGNVAFLLVDPV